MADSDKVKRARELLEELDALPFVAGERGYGESEIDLAYGRIWRELGEVLDLNATCHTCGAKIGGWHGVNECEKCLEDWAYERTLLPPQ